MPDELPAGADDIRIDRNPGFDPLTNQGMTPELYFLWERISSGTTLANLSDLGAISETLEHLRQLRALGALRMDETTARVLFEEDEIESDDDSQILQEVVELDEWQKERFLKARVQMRAGHLRSFLGVKDNASKEQLLSAYNRFSDELDPERFTGLKLGSYAAILSNLYAAVLQAVKTLGDSRTTAQPTHSPRRRYHNRLLFRATVRTKCESWKEAERLATRDLSNGGLYVISKRTAKVSEPVFLRFASREHGSITLSGTVSWVRPLDVSEANKPPGFGVKLDPLGADERAAWRGIVEAVRSSQPAPERDPPSRDPALIQERMKSQPRRGRIVVGIDLGTTNTSVSALVRDKIALLPWPSGELAIPSVVSFPGPGQHEVGHKARTRLSTDPKHTVASAKRLLGRRADDRDVQGLLSQAAYEHSVGPDGYVTVKMWGHEYAIVQLISYLLAAARDAAENCLGHRVDQAVVAVPVTFGPEQIELVRRAGKLAQLEIIDVLEEPTAAAMANRTYPDFGGLVGIYDFGGGTFDFSVVDASGGDLRVLGTSGDSWLGGDDLDLAVAEAVANMVWRAKNIDLRNRAVEWQQLLFAVEGAKQQLSTSERVSVALADALGRGLKNEEVSMTLRRDQAERLWLPIVERSLATCQQAMGLLDLGVEDLSQIYVSGGTVYTPLIRETVARRFQKPVRTLVPPEYAVCLGTGVHAAQLERGMAVDYLLDHA